MVARTQVATRNGDVMSNLLQADHILIKRLMKIQAKKGKKVDPKKKDFDKVSKTFSRLGGSWEKIFKGDTQQMTLLKKIIKVGIEKELFTKKED